MNELQHLAKPKDGPAPRWFHIAVAASMVISAISALVATLHTGRTMTALVEQNAKLVRAGSTPVLEFGHGNREEDGSSAVTFNVGNAGSGLARVVWFELKLDGKPMPHMGAVLQALKQQDASMAVAPALTAQSVSLVTASIEGRMLAPRSDVRMFTWAKPVADNELQVKLWNLLDKARFTRITAQACFCSVFQECWLSDLKGEFPKPSATCEQEKRVSLQG
jgi:hypothetical protein